MSPTTRRSRPGRGSGSSVDETNYTNDIVAAETANRAALRRRLERVAHDEEARGHHDEAALAIWFARGVR